MIRMKYYHVALSFDVMNRVHKCGEVLQRMHSDRILSTGWVNICGERWIKYGGN
ncbi:MAG: hypothetical protein DDT32_00144 [Syntrophomonadaceae bacterium]|nr:hypothetical protein [Bacillota bacterium]